MQYQADIPIYVQIAAGIKQTIIRGEVAEGQKLKSIKEYSEWFKVTPLTIQRALAKLEQEGVIATQKGVGSFVQAGAKETLLKAETQALLKSFVQTMKKMGYTQQDIILQLKEGLKNGLYHYPEASE